MSSLRNEISHNASQINDSLLRRAASLLTLERNRYPSYELSIMYHNVIGVYFVSVYEQL